MGTTKVLGQLSTFRQPFSFEFYLVNFEGMLAQLCTVWRSSHAITKVVLKINTLTVKELSVCSSEVTTSKVQNPSIKLRQTYQENGLWKKSILKSRFKDFAFICNLILTPVQLHILGVVCRIKDSWIKCVRKVVIGVDLCRVNVLSIKYEHRGEVRP